MSNAALQLPPAELAQYAANLKKARAVRHQCVDCNDIDDFGNPCGPCDRHALRCVGCGSEAVEERDPHEYEDGVPAYWCRACIRGDQFEQAPGRGEA